MRNGGNSPPIRPNGPLSENEKWWPVDDKWGLSQLRRNAFDSTMKSYEGMNVPELKEVPDPKNPETITIAGDTKMAAVEERLYGITFDEEKKLLPPATFDP